MELQSDAKCLAVLPSRLCAARKWTRSPNPNGTGPAGRPAHAVTAGCCSAKHTLPAIGCDMLYIDVRPKEFLAARHSNSLQAANMTHPMCGTPWHLSTSDSVTQRTSIKAAAYAWHPQDRPSGGWQPFKQEKHCSGTAHHWDPITWHVRSSGPARKNWLFLKSTATPSAC